MSFIDFNEKLSSKDFKYIEEYGWVTLGNLVASATESQLLDEISQLKAVNYSLQRQVVDASISKKSSVSAY